MVIPSNQTSYLSLKLYHIFILKLYCIPFTAICFFFSFLRLRIRVCYCNVILLLLLFSALDSVFIHLPIVLIAEKEMAFRSSRVGIPSSVSSKQRNEGFNKILVEKFLITFRLIIRLFILHFLFESNNSFSKKNSGKNKKARGGGRERRHKRTLDTF